MQLCSARTFVLYEVLKDDLSALDISLHFCAIIPAADKLYPKVLQKSLPQKQTTIDSVHFNLQQPVAMVLIERCATWVIASHWPINTIR